MSASAETTPSKPSGQKNCFHKKSFFHNKGTYFAALGTAAIIGFGVASLEHQLSASTSPLALESAVPVAGFADMVEKVAPAVVSVTVTGRASPVSARPQLPDNHPLAPFFHGRPGMPGQGESQGRGQAMPAPRSQGSGFVISSDGYIVTNHHVVENGVDVMVSLTDGRELKAEIVGTDEKTDLALLKVESGESLPYVAFEEKDDLRVGDWVVAVGNPFGLGGTVTSGIVSARGRDIGAGPYDDFIQIDASINSGNSGGPTFDLAGNVVGVNTAIFSPSGGNVGIGFAIPASVASKIVADLKDKGRVERGWLGVAIQPVGPDMAESLGLDNEDGALIAEVMEGSPAMIAGLKRGDVIRSIDGHAMDAPKDVSKTVAGFVAGQSVDFEIWRDGEAEPVRVEIGAYPEEQVAAHTNPAMSASQAVASLGVTVEEADGGVVIRAVDPASDAALKGLRPGDVILEAGGQKVEHVADLIADIGAASEAHRKSLLLLVRSAQGQRFVAVKLQAT
ncbi:MAG: Do family serine endopeptidase [Alphaproteobacteria bacterium]|nr:Do family serine endopeptidase [Alphaproteobacteria bacterium]MBO6628852.1 Do family serine endopeptidase [Alphaproteobacteria bacterium]